MPQDVQRIRETLKQIRGKSVTGARSMIGPYYTDPDYLQLEEEIIFGREWVCIGHLGELPETNSFFTTQVAKEPLLITRTETGVRVLSNVCRHRGNLIVQGSGKQKRFTCAYHAWSYSADGNLIAAPHMDKIEGFDRANCSLPEFRSEIWNGFIYVNFDETAAPLSEQLGELDEIIKNYDLADRNMAYVEETRWATNWKCLAENFMEGYHLTPTHLKTLHPITPTSLCKKMENGAYHTGYYAKYTPDYPDRKPFPEGLTEEERRQSPMFWVAPNHVVGLATNNCVYMSLLPDGPDGVRIKWGVLSTAEADSKPAQDYVALCHEFNAEDKLKLETLQIGLKSAHFTPGLLAGDDLEGTIWDIYQFMAERLASDVELTPA